MWVYCGGKTAEIFVNELKGQALPYNQLGDFVGRNMKDRERKLTGIVVADISLTENRYWEDIWKLCTDYTDTKIVIVTTRVLDIPPQELLPKNVEVYTVDKLRVDKVNDIMFGGLV